MKVLVLMTFVISLGACSSETGPLPGAMNPDASPNPIRGLYPRDTGVAALSDGGGDADLSEDGDTPLDDAATGSAGGASIGSQDGGAGSDGSDVPLDDAGQDSGLQVPSALARELFVGSWSGRSLSTGHPCEEEITTETVQCPTVLACGSESIEIEDSYELVPAQVDFLRWDPVNVWVGAYDNDFQDDHRSLRLWLVDEDTMLGDYRTEHPITGTVCTPWMLTRD